MTRNGRQDTSDEDIVYPRLADGLAPIDPAPTPAQAVRERLLARAGRSAAAHAGLLTVRSRDGLWNPVREGVAMKLLWQGARGNSVLIRLAANARLPVHRHRWAEEGIVLDGDLYLGEQALHPGDFHLSMPGSRHDHITSRGGGVAYLGGTSLGDRGGVLMELLGGLLPHRGSPPLTRTLADNRWRETAPGVEECVLRNDASATTRLIRLAPGCTLAAAAMHGDEERLVVDGDAYFGDMLLQAGDFQVPAAEARPCAIESDGGALLLLRRA